MKKQFVVLAQILGFAAAAHADITPDAPIVEQEKIYSFQVAERDLFETRANFSVGSRSDFLPNEGQANFGTIGGEFEVNLRPFFVVADGYYGMTYTKNQEDAFENTASAEVKMGGYLPFDVQEMFKFAPFAGYSYDATWIADTAVQTAWTGPLVGLALNVQPMDKMVVTTSYSHHFLDYQKGVVQGALSGKETAPAQGEKVGVDFRYALSKALDLGFGATYLYFYKDQNGATLKGDEAKEDGVIEKVTLAVNSPETFWRAIQAAGNITYRF